MAKRVIHQLIDDIDGSEATDTIHFGLDGIQYEIDLSEGNAVKLRDALGKYVGAGSRVGRMGGPGGHRATVTRRQGPPVERHSREQLNAVREWARSQGIEISDRGRVPVDVMAKFEEAHKPAEKPVEAPEFREAPEVTAEPVDAPKPTRKRTAAKK